MILLAPTSSWSTLSLKMLPPWLRLLARLCALLPLEEFPGGLLYFPHLEADA
jgi:hypothetical protein